MKKFDNFCKALENLKESKKYEEPYDNITLTGITGLFEICFELSWKAMKAILEDHGRVADKIGSPKIIIKLAYSAGLIDDEELWIELLDTRNLLAHTYNEETAREAVKKIKTKYIELFEKLKSETEKNWI